ncbi:sulfatase [Halioglobus sp.]|nr:sulfatase [Halioglobus sp.]
MLLLAHPVTGAEKPNILFILADDLGWMDSSIYGSGYYQTPGLEHLASMGVQLTRAYSASPVCSPTRLSLLTGKYPARLGLTGPSGHRAPSEFRRKYSPQPAAPFKQTKTPVSTRFMPPEEYTLAEAFSDAGYLTGFIGKWHLGINPEHWPGEQGFDHVIHGVPDAGPGRYFSPYKFKAGNITTETNGEYITERMTSEAIKFIKKANHKPWMLFLSHWAVHEPLEAPQKLIDKYSLIKDPRGRHSNPVMGAMIESLDTSITDLLGTLEDMEILDTTIIIFFSDNGGRSFDRFGNLLTSNYPLRGGKGSIYEGGTRVPAVIVWPDLIEGGSTSNVLTSSIDFYPTLLEMAEIAPREDHIVDGVSLVDTLTLNKPHSRDTIFSHHPNYNLLTKNRPATYVIKGDWKYIRFYDSNGPQGYEPKALYHLKEDVSEKYNLWKAMPEKVDAMDSLISDHLTSIGALLPVPNPDYTPNAYNPFIESPIDSWVAEGRSSIRRKNDALHITSKGDAPIIYTQHYINTSNPASISFRARMKSRSSIRVQGSDTASPRWNSSWQRDLGVPENDSWQEYKIIVPKIKKLQKLRFYMGEAGTEASIDWIRVVNRKGEITKSWEFDAQ